MPYISIMIVNYNSGDMLKYCLESLCKQTYKNFEVIVIDNASVDRSFKDIDRDSLKDLSIRFFFNDDNLGFAVGMNQCAKLGEGKWLAALNPDAMVDKNWVGALAQATKKYPEVAMFGSTQIKAGTKNVLDGCGDVYYFAGLPYRGGYGKKIRKNKIPETGEVFSPCAAASMYNREVFFKIGGFDNSFFCYCEDVDLAFRMRLQGEYCIQLREAGVFHVGGVSSKSKRSVSLGKDFALRHGTRNMIWVFFKNMPTPLLLLFLPAHMFMLMVLVLRQIRKKKHKVVLGAISEAFRGLGPILESRKYVQSSRKVGLRALMDSFTYSPIKLMFRKPDIKKLHF